MNHAFYLVIRRDNMAYPLVPDFWFFCIVVTFKDNIARPAYIIDSKKVQDVRVPRCFICWKDVWESDLMPEERQKIIERGEYHWFGDIQ